MTTYTDILGIENNVFIAKNKKAMKAKAVNTSKNPFAQAFLNKTTTENGALTNVSTLDSIVDFYFKAPALRRETDDNRILQIFVNAFEQNKQEALRLLFWLRDVREGAGERRTFRVILKYLGNVEKDWICRNLDFIPKYGRYDDLLCLLETKCRDAVITFIGLQLELDLKNHVDNKINEISLLAKWLPDEKISNKDKKRWFNILLNSGKFGSYKAYRKAIHLLRKDIDIVERKIHSKDYASIDYEKLPSYSAIKYRKAYDRYDNKRYTKYLDAVKENKAKINTGTLYPYNLIVPYMSNFGYIYCDVVKEDPTLEEAWKNLPDYVPEINGLCVCDTSGSMTGLPMQVAMSLTLYIAERNKSELWRNFCIPFSSKAEFIEIKGNSVLERLKSIFTGDCSNTNLQAVFDLILDRAKSAGIKNEDMPKVLLIMSDMEFDATKFSCTNYERIKQKYAEKGYTLPKLVWWNIESRNDQVPVTVSDEGNLLLSGCSPAIMKVAFSGEYNIREVVDKIINSPRYEGINY